jgi:hypothetical protein
MQVSDQVRQVLIGEHIYIEELADMLDKTSEYRVTALKKCSTSIFWRLAMVKQ